MSNNNNISSELNNISPAVATIGNTNVYSVPSFYFDGLSLEILRKINAEELLQQPSSVNYSVPENYFENLSSEIITKIHQEDSFHFSKINPYTVPSNYFINLGSEILNSLKSENISVENELETVAPILNTISKNNIYSVPTNYFKELEINKPKTTLKVIHFSSWIRYAAAAVVIGIISITAFNFFNTSSQNTTPNSTANINVEKELQNFSDDEIIKFLDNHANGTDAIAQINTPQEDYNSDDLLNTLTEEDIEKYLKETNL